MQQHPTTKCDADGVPYLWEEHLANGEIHYKRADGDYDVPLELSDEDLAWLEEQAKERGVTVNDIIVEALQRALDEHRPE